MWFGELASYEQMRPTDRQTAMQVEWWKTPWLTPQKIMHQCNIKMAAYKVQTTFFSPSFFFETSSLLWCDWLASSKPELPSHLTTSGTGFTAAFWEQSRVPLRTVFGWPLSYVKEQHWKAWCVCLCVFCVCVCLCGGNIKKDGEWCEPRSSAFFSPGWCSVIVEWAGLCVRVTATKYAVGCRL